MYRKVKIETEKTYLPVVKFMLEDNTIHWAIIDTGAHFSMLDKSLNGDKNEKITCNMITISSGEGQEVQSASKKILFSDIDDNKFLCQINGFEIKLHNMAEAVKTPFQDNIKIDLIIGNHDLMDYQCKLDLKNGYLLIQEKA